MKLNIKILKYPIFLFFVLCSLFFVVAVSAAEPKSDSLNLLKNAGNAAGYAAGTTGESTLAATIGKIINGALGLLGVIFLVLTVYAGYLWLTAGGEEEKVTEAKKYLKNSLIGLIIVLASWGVARFVVQAIINSTMGE